MGLIERRAARYWVCRALIGAGIMATPFLALAGMLQISPVMVNLSATSVATTLTLRNPGSDPLYGQVRVFKWDQTRESDALVPSDELIASPPIIQIPAHSDQLVRLVRRNPAPMADEQSYRLLIDELPEPGTQAAPGVTIRLRYSVPVFIEAGAPNGQADLSWTLGKRDGQWYLAAKNDGKRRAQIAAVSIVDTHGDATVVNKGLLGYALAGREREWKVDLPQNWTPNHLATLHAVVNSTAITSGIVVLDAGSSALGTPQTAHTAGAGAAAATR